MKRKAYIGALIGGVLTAVPIMLPKLFLLGLVSFALPAYIEYTADERELLKRRSYLRGMCHFMGFGLVIFSWFCAMYPLEFTGLGKGAAVAVVCAGWIGLSLLQAVFWSFLFLFMGVISRHTRIRSYPSIYCLVFACLYVVFEWMSTKTWAAVPWGRLAVGQTEFLPMIQISSVLGSYAVTFILVFFGCALGVAVAKYRAVETVSSLRPLAFAAAILALNISFGIVRGITYSVPDNSREVTVAAIQGNISSHEKWTDESYYKTQREYMALTLAAAEEGACITVFPETPITYNINGNSGSVVKRYFEAVAEDSGCTVITGVFTKNDDGVSENSVIAVSPNNGVTPQKYVKRHLVPFGEYVPMRKFVSVIFPPLSDIAMLSGDLAAGSEATLLDTEYGKIAPLICFDSIYETLAMDSIRAGGELITLSTNDSWFLDSAAVWEHNRHAVLRSVEFGRYIVRSANTGVSSVISPVGEIIRYIDPLETGYITADVYMISENTVYTVIGNVFIPLCFVGVILSLVYCHVKKPETEDN